LTSGGFRKAVFFVAAGIAILLISLADEQQAHISRNRTNLPKMKPPNDGALVGARGFDLAPEIFHSTHLRHLPSIEF
jgi:hypothetical protein